MAFGFQSKNKSRSVRSVSSEFTHKRIVSSRRKNSSEKSSTSVFTKFLVRFLILIFIGVTVYILFLSPFLTVRYISVDGTRDIDDREVSDVAMETIQGKYLGTLMRNNIILINKAHITKELRRKFKRIEDVNIVREFPDKLLIDIEEYKTALVFCGGDMCFVVDDEARAFAEADFDLNELGEKDLLVLRDLSQREMNIENLYIDVNVVNFIADIKDRLEMDMDIVLKQECQTNMIISGDFQFETSEGWKIYVSRAVGTDKSIEMLETALNNVIDKNIMPKLDYIDLRLNNKVYYKLKNEVIATETESVATVPVVAPVVEKKKK